MNENFNNLIILLEKIPNDSINVGDELFLKDISIYISRVAKDSIIYDFLNSKIEINHNSFDIDKNISEKLLKNIINYFHKDGNIYTCYDSEIFHSNNDLNKKILFYFKTIELITSYFIVHNETIIIYSKYVKYIYALLELFRFKVYKHLGYDEIPPYKIWNYQTQTMNEIKSKNIDKVTLEILKYVDSYNFDEQTINQETKSFLVKYYNLWWERYKKYIDDNFPALNDKLEYYQGLNIDIYFCKLAKMDESKFGNSDLALCVGMSKNINSDIHIDIREEIHQIIFLNDVYENIDDVVVTLAFDTETYNDDLHKIISTEIPEKVNSSIINYYKETIDYENYIRFTEKLLEEIGHAVLNKSKSLILEDYITHNKTFYTIEYSQSTSKEIVEDLSKRKKKEHNLLIINKEILNNNMKKIYLEQNIYIKDIDDMFNMFAKLKRKEHILKELIYPYLENQIGSLKKIDSINISNHLINQIKNCPLGRDGWKQFEDIIEKVLNFVFKNSFRTFLLKPQSKNISGTDIKDYIIRNNGINGFWQDMKTTYNCNNIIVECKNYKSEIGIKELRQVSDYLSKDTYGQFAIIFSRKGLDRNGKEKQSDYLKFSPKKMILVLDEDDIIDLIKKRSRNESPEEILEYMTYNVELQT